MPKLSSRTSSAERTARSTTPWQQADADYGLSTEEPYGGGLDRETEVRILYTRTEIYFGIFCQDSVAHGVIATQLRRDVTQELDDYFEIVIDPRHDRRNAYVFQVNPLGTQKEMLGLRMSRRVTRRMEIRVGMAFGFLRHKSPAAGWTATVAIPFATLNFMRSHDVIWGINFKRFIRRKNEEDLWSAWRRTFGANKISEAGELHGITEIGSGRLFIIKPYALGGFNHLPPSAAEAAFRRGRVLC